MALRNANARAPGKNQGREESLGTSSGRAAGEVGGHSRGRDLLDRLGVNRLAAIAAGNVNDERDRRNRLAEMAAERAIVVRLAGALLFLRRLVRVLMSEGAMIVAVRALTAAMAAVVGMRSCSPVADGCRATRGSAVMGMPHPADDRAEALQGNRQAGGEATGRRDKGEHGRANCFKNARRSQVLLNCISDG
jgi:hypothetical protein